MRWIERHLTTLRSPDGDGGAAGGAGGAAGGAGGGGDQGGAGAGAGAGSAKPWHDGLPPEVTGTWDLKGWKKDDPKVLVTELTKAWKGLEQHFGVPAERLVKLPKDAADEAGLKEFRARLGVPSEPKDYDFSGVKFADGTDLEAAFQDTMRGALHKAGVPKDAGPDVVKAVVKYLGDADTAEAAERTAKIQAGITALAREWGPSFEFNKLTAMQGAQRLGVSPEIVEAIQQVAGYEATMKLFHKIGRGTSEDTFVESRQDGVVSTRAGAVARKAELMADVDWAGRYMKGDPKAKQEMDNLIQIIAGVAA